jgi:hypothetical protein
MIIAAIIKPMVVCSAARVPSGVEERFGGDLLEA